MTRAAAPNFCIKNFKLWNMPQHRINKHIETMQESPLDALLYPTLQMVPGSVRRVLFINVIRLGVVTGSVGCGIRLRAELVPPALDVGCVLEVWCWFPCLPLPCAGQGRAPGSSGRFSGAVFVWFHRVGCTGQYVWAARRSHGSLPKACRRFGQALSTGGRRP